MIKLAPRPPRKVTETDLVYEAVQSIGRIRGVRASRNNVGTLEDKRGIPVTYGLGEGSPDVVGVITVGGAETAIESLRHLPPLAFAFGIEVKRPRSEGGKSASRVQRAWHHVARRRGMPVGLARSGAEAVDFVLEVIRDLEHRLRGLT